MVEPGAESIDDVFVRGVRTFWARRVTAHSPAAPGNYFDQPILEEER
jgi:hypothetical protein